MSYSSCIYNSILGDRFNYNQRIIKTIHWKSKNFVKITYRVYIIYKSTKHLSFRKSHASNAPWPRFFILLSHSRRLKCRCGQRWVSLKSCISMPCLVLMTIRADETKIHLHWKKGVTFHLWRRACLLEDSKSKLLTSISLFLLSTMPFKINNYTMYYAWINRQLSIINH